jgi:hypothetical protein
MENLDSDPTNNESDFNKIFPKYTPGQFTRINDNPYPKSKRRGSDAVVNLTDEVYHLSPMKEVTPPLAIKNRKETEQDISFKLPQETPKSLRMDSDHLSNPNQGQLLFEEEKGDISMIEPWKFEK